MLTSPVQRPPFSISPTESLLKRSRLQHQDSTSNSSFQGKESSHLPEVTKDHETFHLLRTNPTLSNQASSTTKLSAQLPSNWFKVL